MNSTQDNNELRNRYRGQSSRSFTHEPVRKQRVIQSRLHAVPQQKAQHNISDSNSIKVHIHKEPKAVAVPSNMFAVAPKNYKDSSPLASGPSHISGQKQSQPERHSTVTKASMKSESNDHRTPTINRKNKHTKTHKQKTKRPQLAVLAVVGLVFIFSLAISVAGWKANPHVEAQAPLTKAPQPQVHNTDMTLDETEVTQDALLGHAVSADQPKRIVIPKIKTDARVYGAGLKNGNQLDIPKNIFDTSWYDKSAKPGSGSGAVMINGHEQGKHKNGSLFGLEGLVQGDQIMIERGDGQIITYEVVKIQNYQKNDVDMTAMMLPVENGKEALNLITSSNEFNKATPQEHIAVFAVRIS